MQIGRVGEFRGFEGPEGISPRYGEFADHCLDEHGRPLRRTQNLRRAGPALPWRSSICSRPGDRGSPGSETKIFSEGNVFVRVLENVRGRDVFVIQGTEHPVNDNFMELLFWIDALKRASATPGHGRDPVLLVRQGRQEGRAPASRSGRSVCADCSGGGRGRPGLR